MNLLHHKASPTDADGDHEKPADKKSHHLAYIGIALAAGGILVAIMLSKRNSAASSGGGYSYPTLSGGGSTGGQGASSGDSSGIQAGFQSFADSVGTTIQNASDQQSQASSTLADYLVAQTAGAQAAQSGLQAALDNLASEFHATTGGTGADMAAHGWDPSKLAPINSGTSPKSFLPGAQSVLTLGSVNNGTFSGHDVGGGAPVYAKILTPYGYGYYQDFGGVDKLKSGTELVTLSQYKDYINPNSH